MEEPSRPLHRSACAECQRRKQKCNREWPCNHCQKRKVADRCRFNNPTSPSDKPAPPTTQKRARSFEEDLDDVDLGHDTDGGDSDDLDLGAMGYMAGPLMSSLMDSKRQKKSIEKLDFVNPDNSPQLKAMLDSLPARPEMDQLVQIFFNNVNYHYYIVYPPRFLEEYQDWWDRRARHDEVTLQWTSLLVVICACATQHLDEGVKPKIESIMGTTAEVLTDKYNTMSKDIAGMMPNGRYHLINIQRMLHAIYWYKAEARFVEAWHLIGAAVRESQELGLHKASESANLPEFEREMRRRVWCILATWDWQFASGLCRPTMIDHTDVDVKSPTLELENLNPSPLLHMKLQSEAITKLAALFGAPKNVKTPKQIKEYKTVIEEWMKGFPKVYDIDDPDMSRDATHPWATSHRFYIHTMAYLMILNPIRTVMAKSFNKSTPKEDREVRLEGVNYSLRNLYTTTKWTEYSSHRDGRYHFIIFSLFDTASVLCAAILKDEDHSIPRREEILVGIERAVTLLRKINMLSKTAKTSYDILVRMVRRMPRSKNGADRKKARMTETKYVSDQGTVTNQGYVPVDDNTHGYSSASTSPSNFAGRSTAGSSPQSNIAGEVFHGSTPDSGAPSIDGRTMSSFSSNTMSYDSQPLMPNNFGNMMPPNMAYQSNPQMPPPQPQPMYTDLQPPVPEMVPGFGFEPITDAELGEFNRLWDWQSLDLDFISSEAVAQGNMQ